METKSLNDFKDNPRNPRSISEHDFKALVESIRRFGDLSGIVVNQTTGHIVGGHQRRRAFAALGGDHKVIIDSRFEEPNAQGTVAVGRFEHKGELYGYREVIWDETTETAANIAANRIQGNWDLDLLAEANYLLHEQAPDLLAMTGQTDIEINNSLDSVAGTGNPEDDEAPPVDDAQPAVSQLGEIYQLGPHRLMCGDSTDFGQVSDLMDGKEAQMAFTDPPWNVAIGLDSNPRHRQREGLENDNMSPEEFKKFVGAFCEIYASILKGDMYCVLGASEWPTLDSQLRTNGFHWSATIIWVKDMFVLGRSKYHRRYEPIWYGWHGDSQSSYNNDNRDRDDVWEIPRPRSSEEHPTMKPIALVEKAILNSSLRGKIVLDLFGGSGTTLLAADKLERVCYMAELSPAYCDVIRKRYHKFKTGSEDGWQEATPVIKDAVAQDA